MWKVGPHAVEKNSLCFDAVSIPPSPGALTYIAICKVWFRCIKHTTLSEEISNSTVILLGLKWHNYMCVRTMNIALWYFSYDRMCSATGMCDFLTLFAPKKHGGPISYNTGNARGPCNIQRNVQPIITKYCKAYVYHNIIQCIW